MFVSKLDEKGFEVRFKYGKVTIVRKHRVCVRHDKLDGMYCIVIDDVNKKKLNLLMCLSLSLIKLIHMFGTLD